MKPVKILFLCYINRSGSTFLAHRLHQFREVCVCPELDVPVSGWLEAPEQPGSLQWAAECKHRLQQDPKFVAWQNAGFTLENLNYHGSNMETFRSLLTLYRNAMKPDAEIVVFKAERLIHLYPMFKYFPDVMWLAVLRDPRAVFHSQRLTPHPDTGRMMAHNPLVLAAKWKVFCKQLIRHNIPYISYERLIAETDTVLNDFAREHQLVSPPDASKDTYWQHLSPAHRALHTRVTLPPDATRMDRWRQDLPPRDRALIQHHCQTLMEHFRYKAESLPYPTVYHSFCTIALTVHNCKRWMYRLVFWIKYNFI